MLTGPVSVAKPAKANIATTRRIPVTTAGFCDTGLDQRATIQIETTSALKILRVHAWKTFSALLDDPVGQKKSRLLTSQPEEQKPLSSRKSA